MTCVCGGGGAGVFETKSHSVALREVNLLQAPKLMNHTSEVADVPALFYSVLFKGMRQVPNIE